MEREKDVFYVVRKGDLVGIYKSFPDCLAQAGCSVSDPSVSVFKGYGLPRDAEDYLASLGLRNAAYSVSATDVQTDLFGKLEPCRIQVAYNLENGKGYLSDSATCPICGGGPVTTMHVIRDRSFARAYWAEVLLDELDDIFFQQDGHRWMLHH